MYSWQKAAVALILFFFCSFKAQARKRGNVFCLSFRPSSDFYSTKTSYGETSVRRFSTHINGELVKVLLDMTWLWPTNTNDNTATHQLKNNCLYNDNVYVLRKCQRGFWIFTLEARGKQTKTEDCTILENATAHCFRNDSKCINSHWTAKVFERDECVSNSVLYINVHKVAWIQVINVKSQRLRCTV